MLREIQSLSLDERHKILELLNEKEKVSIKSGTLCDVVKPYQIPICCDCGKNLKETLYSCIAVNPPPPSKFVCACADIVEHPLIVPRKYKHIFKPIGSEDLNYDMLTSEFLIEFNS